MQPYIDLNHIFMTHIICSQIAKKYYLMAYTTSFYDTNGALAGLDILETFVSTQISTNLSNTASLNKLPSASFGGRVDKLARPWPMYTKQMSFLWQKWKRVLNLGDNRTASKLPGFYQLRTSKSIVQPSTSGSLAIFTVLLNTLKASMYQELGLVDLDVRSYRNSLRPATYHEVVAQQALSSASRESSIKSHLSTSHSSSSTSSSYSLDAAPLVHYLTVSSDLNEGLDALWHSAILSGINLQVSKRLKSLNVRLPPKLFLILITCLILKFIAGAWAGNEVCHLRSKTRMVPGSSLESQPHCGLHIRLQ